MRYKNAKWKNQSKKKARMEYQYLFSIFIKKKHNELWQFEWKNSANNF